MLVITRKSTECFCIGDNIKITVLEVTGDKVKIGIDAPKDVKIVRSEVVDIIESNIKAASTNLPKDINIEPFCIITKK